MRRAMRAALIAGCLLLSLPPALAEEQTAAVEPPIARAREAFRLGSGLARQGQWADALAAFERSRRLHRHAATVYNIGYCERALGRYTRARRAFLEARAQDQAAPAPELSDAQRTELEAYLSEIEPRLARALVTVVQPGTAITVDGRPLEQLDAAASRLTLVAGTRDPGPPEQAPAASFDLVLDPGDHLVALSHADGRGGVRSERFAAETVRELVLDIGSTEVAAPSLPDEPPPAPATYLAFALGGAALATSIVSGSVALATKLDLDERCASPEQCPDDAQPDIDRLRASANVATVAAGIGVAGMGLGVALLLTTPSESSAPALVYAVPTRDGVSLGVRARY